MLRKSDSNFRVGLIGAGAIGQHHARILSNMDGFDFVGIADTNAQLGGQLCEKYGGNYYPDSESLLKDVDVVYIATPTVTHYDLANQALCEGKHVLVEKPLADTVEHAQSIVNKAQECNLMVVVGHVERFNPAIRWFKQHLDPASVLTVNITRVGPRPPRIKDVGIVVDLAVHDIDLMGHLCESDVIDIRSFVKCTSGIHEDVAQIITRTESNVVGSITTNWLTPYKSRRIEIATPGALFDGDLITGTVIRYEGLDLSGTRYVVEKQTPRISEPLREQSEAFLRRLRGDASENASAEEGCAVVKLAQQCLSNSLAATGSSPA